MKKSKDGKEQCRCIECRRPLDSDDVEIADELCSSCRDDFIDSSGSKSYLRDDYGDI